MGSLPASEARDHFGEILNRVAYGHERVVVERRGKDLAALVSMRDLKILEAIEDRMDLRDALAALAEADEKGTVPLDKLLDEFGIED